MKTQLRKYAVEWIENHPKGKFHLFRLYDYLADHFQLECVIGGNVSTGEPRYQIAVALHSLVDCDRLYSPGGGSFVLPCPEC